MINTLWLQEDGTKRLGGEEQVAQWQTAQTGYLWVDIHSENVSEEKALLLKLGCHPLAVDDAQRKRHPPKTETFDDQVLILYRGITHFDEDLNMTQVPIALFASKNLLISVRQSKSLSIQQHWNDPKGDLLRQPALLAIRIMNYSVGRYLEAMLAFEERINDLEDAMQERPSDEIMRSLIAYKSRLRKLKRTFSYHEGIAQSLLRETPAVFTDTVDDINHSLQDLFDRCERAHSLATMFYEICGDLIEGYLSLTSHMLNNTMRVLTVITAIFVPLTFIAGIYGMNFEYIPELHYRNGYFIVMGLMGLTGAGLLVLFRKLRWL
ncbi:magnesium transporter CorA family protein [Gilvimarinus agarilyticus]|uniref:magnesium transporter CorA family protein n=1 Tax=unclassified Gilvimarinus TaxID=2642066 RepID=UPI001C09411A|nr:MULTISPECIES: magnesium transporter CorA family protein [unclassified Gilvimarinus]MBU2885672.1 magnesium transporter CorA family protein [Gilvimarinus agarilyticus]MDO6570531.1 magnesium transporter CorA family protein [Gilvimarinus sp. 2_MG-2023]MDO6747472.1 magnesium transporter CorA family protein [Gilvimarinus sp. 1_MG-2023]